MTVETHQLHMGLGKGKEGNFLRLPRLDGSAELGVHLTRCHRLVGVGVDAGAEAQQHLLPLAAAGALGFNGADFLHIVRHEVAHAAVHSIGDVAVSLIAAVEVGMA